MREASVPPSPRRRRTRQETRHEIVDAAFRLFSQNGFSRTSVREIAGAVGITDAALYHHFDSKKELLDAVLDERGVGRWLELIEKTRVQQPLSVALERTAVAALVFIDQNQGLFRLVLFEALAGDSGVLAHHADMMRRWREGVQVLLSAQDGQPAQTRALTPAEHVVATLWGLAVERLLGTNLEPFADAHGAPTSHCRAVARLVVERVLAHAGPDTLH